MNIYYFPPPPFSYRNSLPPPPSPIQQGYFEFVFAKFCSIDVQNFSGYLKRNCYCTLQNVMSYLFEWLLSAKSLLQMAGCVNKGHIY